MKHKNGEEKDTGIFKKIYNLTIHLFLKPIEFIPLDFQMYIEPEKGINNSEEFAEELLKWGNREHRSLLIKEYGMKPIIYMDGKDYICRLGNPCQCIEQEKIFRFPGINQYMGKWLGYKWIYLYEIQT